MCFSAQLRKVTDYKLPASQIANSQGCGYLLAAALKRAPVTKVHQVA
jgi:hypothetical protein